MSTNKLVTTIQSLTEDVPSTTSNDVIVIDTLHNRIGVKINQPQYEIDVSGTINCTDILATYSNVDSTTTQEVQTNIITLTSDDRFKHNEKNITDGLNVIRKLNPQLYDKTKTFKKANYKGIIKEPYIVEAGFIAQEVNKINELKFTVTEGSLIKPYYLNYNNIFVYSVAAIKEIDKEINYLKTEIKLTKEINDIKLIKEDLYNKYNNLINNIELINNKLKSLGDTNNIINKLNIKLHKVEANYNNKDRLIHDNLLNLQKIIRGQNNTIEKLTTRINKLENNN
tara:strand:+ start:343 stop:1191 length:849 start_codon:yes stop_codon:yes gene_type:complete